MRIEGIQATTAIRRMPVVARLRGVARPDQANHADQSRNRMIAAVHGTPNTEAAAPIRRLSRDERVALEQLLGAGPASGTRSGAPVAAPSGAATPSVPAAPRAPGPPPSIPIQHADPPSGTSREAARLSRDLAASRAYTRTAEASNPGERFDIRG